MMLRIIYYPKQTIRQSQLVEITNYIGFEKNEEMT